MQANASDMWEFQSQFMPETSQQMMWLICIGKNSSRGKKQNKTKKTY